MKNTVILVIIDVSFFLVHLVPGFDYDMMFRLQAEQQKEPIPLQEGECEGDEKLASEINPRRHKIFVR